MALLDCNYEAIQPANVELQCCATLQKLYQLFYKKHKQEKGLH